MGWKSASVAWCLDGQGVELLGMNGLFERVDGFGLLLLGEREGEREIIYGEGWGVLEC